ncbi:MAG: hypothetical protein IEMM0002_1275 [bacterium]|nr:MAG: hypothetical protein IEMM0002_1275 [bacterium]
MFIKSIMIRSVVTVRRGETIKNTARKMAKKSVSCVVVTRKKIPVGIFTDYDLLGVMDDVIDLYKTKIETVMSAPVTPINESADYFAAARNMSRMEVRRFIVVNGDGKLCGIVTATDIVKSFATRSLSYRTRLGAVASQGLTATPNTPLKKIARMMMEGRRYCVAIIKNRKPIGLITTFQLVKLAARYKEPLKEKASARMIKDIAVADTAGSLRESVMMMLKKKRQNIVVIDDRGWYCGMVAQNELVSFIDKSHL